MPVAQSLATIELSEAYAGSGSGLTTTIQQLGQVGDITLFVAVASGVGDGATIERRGFILAFSIAAASFMLAGALIVHLMVQTFVFQTKESRLSVKPR